MKGGGLKNPKGVKICCEKLAHTGDISRHHQKPKTKKIGGKGIGHKSGY